MIIRKIIPADIESIVNMRMKMLDETTDESMPEGLDKQIRRFVRRHMEDGTCMGVLAEDWNDTVIPSKAYQQGGIQEVIALYEDNVFYEILAEELSRRDMGYAEINADNYDEIVERIGKYMQEFSLSGVDRLVLED